MATDARGPRRRDWMAHSMAHIAALASAGLLPGALLRAAEVPQRFAAAWERAEGGWEVGVLATPPGVNAASAEVLDPQSRVEVPTRAHGLLAERAGTLLAVARRPGDWLLRWHPATAKAQWAWIEDSRAYNGHVIASADGRQLYTTETDLETGAGLIGVRDAASLEKTAEWPTGGMDPHELLLDADGSVLVANGGIPTLPETGRLKIGLDRMDASLSRLDGATGTLRGQWRLDDRRLSLRHIAWGEQAGRRVLGIALQAEHADKAQRGEAPLLALFDRGSLRTVAAPRPLAGYGGDIAFANGHFAVSCPRAHGVAIYGAWGQWQRFAPLREACALSADLHGGPGGIWAAGIQAARSLADKRVPARNELALAGLRLDNHWIGLPRTS